MSAIGGVLVNPDITGQYGSAYGSEGTTQLSTNAATSFIQLARSLDEHNVIKAICSNEVHEISTEYFEAATCVVKNQALTVLVLKGEPGKAYVFDPESFTYLGGLEDVFSGIYKNIEAEQIWLEYIAEIYKAEKDLAGSFTSAAILAKATANRQQAASEFVSLKQCADHLKLYMKPETREQLAQLCTMMTPSEDRPCASVATAKSSGWKMPTWLTRVLGA